MTRIPVTELNDRMRRFRVCMDVENRDWELAAIFGRVSQYYFTGTAASGGGPLFQCLRDVAPILPLDDRMLSGSIYNGNKGSRYARRRTMYVSMVSYDC